MAFETIENVKPKYAAAPTVPPHGVLVTTRKAPTSPTGGGEARYITIRIGAALAKAARFHAEAQDVRLMFGSGSDAGKIAVAMQTGGGFVAKRQKAGGYALTINRLAAADRFTLDFPPFTIPNVEAVVPQNGQPPMFVFKASAAMLAVGDD